MLLHDGRRAARTDQAGDLITPEHQDRQLNRAVAVGMAEAPAAGLALVAELESSDALTGYHLLAATRADLLRRLGRPGEAEDSYRGRARIGDGRLRAEVSAPQAR